jgi:hypothetical protein
MTPLAPQATAQIARWITEAVTNTPVYDLHTHLYPANFGSYMLWGIDELLTYHYLTAETIRAANIPYDAYWALSQKAQAELNWKTLFVDRAPVSEACRGVVTVLSKLGVDLSTKNLNDIRQWYAKQQPGEFVDKVFKLANVHTAVMTNDALDPKEREIWLKGPEVDPRFKGVLRVDPLLYGWPMVGDTLRGMGYNVGSDLGGESLAEIRRFLNEWIDRMKAIYVAVSITPDWKYPDDSAMTRVIREAILPVTQERNIPFAVMIGVRRQINPQLKMAGDSLGKADIMSLVRLCEQNPENKFMATMLSRENQHELCVTARKFPNLFLFGCWWFLNNPSLIEEITRMRMELLGTSFVPQHSDCRILDQLVYKWDHSRAVIAKVMTEKFTDLAQAGWPVTREEVERTAKGYLSGNFESYLKATL